MTRAPRIPFIGKGCERPDRSPAECIPIKDLGLPSPAPGDHPSLGAGIPLSPSFIALFGMARPMRGALVFVVLLLAGCAQPLPRAAPGPRFADLASCTMLGAPCKAPVPSLAIMTETPSPTTICITMAGSLDRVFVKLLYDPSSKAYSLAYHVPKPPGPLFGLVKVEGTGPLGEWGPGGESATVPLPSVKTGQAIVAYVHFLAVVESSFASATAKLEWYPLNATAYPIQHVSTERGDAFLESALRNPFDSAESYAPISVNATGEDYHLLLDAKEIISVRFEAQETPSAVPGCS